MIVLLQTPDEGLLFSCALAIALPENDPPLRANLRRVTSLPLKMMILNSPSF